MPEEIKRPMMLLVWARKSYCRKKGLTKLSVPFVLFNDFYSTGIAGSIGHTFFHCLYILQNLLVRQNRKGSILQSIRGNGFVIQSLTQTQSRNLLCVHRLIGYKGDHQHGNTVDHGLRNAVHTAVGDEQACLIQYRNLRNMVFDDEVFRDCAQLRDIETVPDGQNHSDGFTLKSLNTGTEEFFRTLQNGADGNVDHRPKQVRKILFLAVINGQPNKVEPILWKAIRERLELAEGIYQITLRRILHNFIQPVTAFQLDAKAFDTVHRPESSDQRNSEDALRPAGGDETTHQFLAGGRGGENADALFAVFFCQMFANEEELLVNQ